jgi:hypothetical protein
MHFVWQFGVRLEAGILGLWLSLVVGAGIIIEKFAGKLTGRGAACIK